MTSIDHLLPAPDEAVRCTEHRRRLGIDPAGTAIRADRVVLIRTPLPWPKPVSDHPLLAVVSPILRASAVPTRTLAFVPPDVAPDGSTADPFGTHTASLVTFERVIVDGRATVVERRYQAEAEADLLALAVALAEDDAVTLHDLAGYEQTLITPVALVCTQGSHDVCCGSEGARFAADAESAAGGLLDDLVVYRVSHTGGHRFAPTAMTLPDGRMWADLDLDLLRQILSRTGSTADVVDHCRGWWGAETGPPQVAELAVFGQAGWELEDTIRTVAPVDGAAAGNDADHRYVVTTGQTSWTVNVSDGRTVPTVACRQPGGLPAKQATEYRVEHIQLDSNQLHN